MLNKQFCFYSGNNSNNIPSSNAITIETLHNGVALAYTYPITQLSIESLPGVKFYLNGNPVPCIIDSSGVFSLNLEDSVLINTIMFDENSLNTIASNGYLVVNYNTLN